MLTRRQCLVALALPEPSGTAAALAWSDLPERAREMAGALGLTPTNWDEWRRARRAALAERIQAGSAEHVTYYFLQSRRFTDLAPLEPMAWARATALAGPAAERAAAYERAKPADERHRVIAALERWPLERCFTHTMSFLRAKEVERAPLDELYFTRGLSSDTAPENTAVMAEAARFAPRRILLAGPGLDLTRREKFDDGRPLRSHQFDWLRQAFPQARIDLADVRPEVLAVLGARRVDVTTEKAGSGYDLIVATNLLLYFEDRELLTAMAGFAQALAPGGRLLHNDQRFAAKVFGEACGLPVERFEAKQTGARHWDRAVIHRKDVA